MTANRIYPGTTVTLQTQVTAGGALTNSASITFKWKHSNFGEEKSITPTNTATGTYQVQITPTRSGNVYYRWDTEGTLNTSKDGVLSVARSPFKV